MLALIIIALVVVLLLGVSAYSTRRLRNRLAAGGQVDASHDPVDPKSDADVNYQAIRDRSTFGGGFPH